MQGVAIIQQNRKGKSIFLLIFFAFCVMAYAFGAPQEVAERIRAAAELFVKTIFPSLFAFSVSAKILVRSGLMRIWEKCDFSRFFAVFGVSQSGFSALFLGFLSGFPMGAVILSDAVSGGMMTKREAERLLPFCNLAGASFVVGVVGLQVFGSARIGRMLFLAQIAAALAALILIGPHEKETPGAVCVRREDSTVSILTSAVTESGSAMLAICAQMVFFSVVSGMFLGVLRRFFAFSEVFYVVLTGILELSSGISMLSEVSLPVFAIYIVSGILLGFGGFCVCFQVADRARAAGLSLGFYLKGKVLMAGLLSGFAPLFCFFAEKRFGGFYVFAVFSAIFCMGVVKNKIFFKKTMEKQKGMLYNRNEIYYP